MKNSMWMIKEDIAKGIETLKKVYAEKCVEGGLITEDDIIERVRVISSIYPECRFGICNKDEEYIAVIVDGLYLLGKNDIKAIEEYVEMVGKRVRCCELSSNEGHGYAYSFDGRFLIVEEEEVKWVWS